MTINSPPLDLNETRGPEIVAVNVVLGFLALLGVGLRLWARHIRGVPLQWSDYMILLSLPFTVLLVVSTCVAVHFGLGRHQAALTNDQFISSEIAQIILQAAWSASVPLVKVSILFLYAQLFPTTAYRLTGLILGILTLAWGIAFTLLIFLKCTPLGYLWDKTIVGGHCVPTHVAYQVASVTNVILDLIVLMLPMPVIYRSQSSRSQKGLMAGMFLLGGLTCITSIVRLVSISHLASISKTESKDITWMIVEVCIWSTAEPCLGTLAASLPLIRPVLYKLFPRAFSKVAPDTTGQARGAISASRNVWLRGGRRSKKATTQENSTLHLAGDMALMGVAKESESISREEIKAGRIEERAGMEDLIELTGSHVPDQRAQESRPDIGKAIEAGAQSI